MQLTSTRWRLLAANLDLELPDSLHNRLLERYAEQHRKYHNEQHLTDCLEKLDWAHGYEAEKPWIEYALWFHDAIYNTCSGQNELKSAEWAVRELQKAGGSAQQCDLVDKLIMATCHTETPQTTAEQFLIDIDLSILGSSPQRYALFEEQIRGEYWWVPKRVYQTRRMEILTSFLQRPAIYSTAQFRTAFETNARSNISWALEMLGGG